MDKKLVAATALAGSLAMASFVWGTAQATPAPSAIHAPGNGITLVGHPGGGGGGGGFGHGGGGGFGHGGGGGFGHGGGGGFAVSHGGGGGWSHGGGGGWSHGGGGGWSHGGGGWSHGGGGRGLAYRSGPGSMSHMDRGYMPRGNYASRDRGYMPRGNYADRGHVYGNRRYAFNDHDHHGNDHHGNDHFHHGRHGHFVNGVWVWWPGYYGGDYYAYNDCWWLRRQALITGSPYWWSRYNACVGYGYY